MQEFIFTLSLVRNSTPEPDILSNRITKHLPEIGIEYSLKDFEICINQIFPDGRRETLVIPILKTGKTVYNIYNIA